MFSQISNDCVLKRSDFHVPKDMKPENMSKQDLYIEAVFSFDEVESENGEESSAIPLFYNIMVIDMPNGKPLLRIRLTGGWERSNNIDALSRAKSNI